ncbi:MAG: hypothetical protein IPM93_18030 [Candidatus Obscuribacter sp.]|nr:hypothetical protein [Candidatus Obscuribacter sp.]
MSRVEDAFCCLKDKNVDLVITRVHLDYGNLFSFLKALKEDPQLSATPVICFCGMRSKSASLQHDFLMNATRLYGAADYLALEHFCEGDDFNLESICQSVERSLANGSQHIREDSAN